MPVANGDFDVLAIGNAIVDVLSHVDDAFLAAHDIRKGTMTLIDEAQAARLYADMPPGVEVSGGSAANTAAGVASFGGRAAYVGKVRNDQLGEVFSHDLRAAGVSYETPPSTEGLPTARCLVMVTPDAHRSMNTFLGASQTLGPEDIDPGRVAAARTVYMEGYLYDQPAACQAFEKAARIAKEAGNKVSLTLSDPFCVERYRTEFQSLVEGAVDLLFANEAEICSLYQTGGFDEALRIVRGKCDLMALTRSEAGSVVVSGGDVHIVEAEPVERLVDTTGAGDLYAAGFLFGYARGHDALTCGRLGSLAAAEIISHFGARPDVSLAGLAARKGVPDAPARG